MGVLKMSGLFKGASGGVSNEQTLSSKGKTLSNPFDKPWSTEWAYSMPYMVFKFE